MPNLTVKRTLVKSPPELWSEVSEVESLARHLGELGEIKISRLEPERTVAWEGERARGTVEIEASGWGTKVTLTAEVESRQSTVDSRQSAVGSWQAEPEPVREPEPEPEVEVEPEPEAPPVMSMSRAGLFSRWFFRQRTEPQTAEPTPEPEPARPPEPEPVAVRFEAQPEPALTADQDKLISVLEGTLDSLGSAHHRPFSRG